MELSRGWRGSPTSVLQTPTSQASQRVRNSISIPEVCTGVMWWLLLSWDKKYYGRFLSLSLKYLFLDQMTFISLENFGFWLQETSWDVHCKVSFYVILLFLSHSLNIKWKNISKPGYWAYYTIVNSGRINWSCTSIKSALHKSVGLKPKILSL